jgi:hypothetical protein
VLKHVVLATMLVATWSEAWAQESTSTPVAKELVALMTQSKLESVAARLPDSPDRFVAALYMPGVQLLVVAARYTTPTLLQEQIWSRNYRDAYVALSGSGSREGKLFVQDLGEPGLQPARNENNPFDIVFENVTQKTLFDGAWREQKLSEGIYKARFKTADERYARVLAALVAELTNSAQSKNK